MRTKQTLPRVAAAAAIATIALVGLASHAHAGAIHSAVGGVINSGGPGFGDLSYTWSQAGLSAGYTSGVTDFDAYIASGPTHTVTFFPFEWFSNLGSTSASVTYDLGSNLLLDAIALWNEESSGIGLLDLLYSTDGTTFTPLLSGLTPTDHGLAAYAADVFSFGAVTARYIRLDMSDCPQPNVGTFAGCAIGEVAFRAADNGVPEPATMALVGLALAGAGFARRRMKAD